MQFEKWGRGLLREAFRSNGEWAGGWKLEGEKGEYQSWKTEVNIGVLPVNINKCKRPNCLPTFLSPPPRAFSQQPTLPHSGKLPAVTQVLFFQTACNMMSHRCVVAVPVFVKKDNCIHCKSRNFNWQSLPEVLFQMSPTCYCCSLRTVIKYIL